MGHTAKAVRASNASRRGIMRECMVKVKLKVVERMDEGLKKQLKNELKK